MKILIADSGSTKTEWAMVGGGTERIVTSGLNPVHQAPEEIEAILRREFRAPVEDVDAVRFYGAGCLPELAGGMADVLRKVFGVEDVSVDSDLAGAARGLLGHGPGVVAILGTGCNSAFYDGERIVHSVPPLGYILGDEGSGAHMGKRLVSDVLKGLLPRDLTEAFYRKYPLKYTEIIEAVYRKPGANRFLAGFAPFLHEHMEHAAARAMVEDSLGAFIERNLMRYDRVREHPVSFTGSIALHFASPLRKAAARYGLKIGKIEKTPMAGLIQYYTS